MLHLLTAAIRRLADGFFFATVRLARRDGSRLSRRSAVGLLGAALFGVVLSAQAVSPPDVSMCTNVDEDFRLRGTAPAFPGAWWNPQRYGTGWNLMYVGEDQLAVVWFTFDRNRQPIWLLSDPAPIINRTFQAALRRYQWDWSIGTHGGQGGNEAVGEVAISFNPEDPARLAVQWQWDEVGSVAADPECLVNYGRDPAPAALNVAASANSAFSGAWQETGLSGWGVAINILPILQAHNAISNYAESGSITAYDDDGNPFWALLGSKNFDRQGEPTAMPPSEFYADPFPLLFVRPKNGYPAGVPINDCSNEGCVDQSLSVGTFNREFLSETRASGVLTVNAAAIPGTFRQITRFDRPAADETRSAVDLFKVSDQTQLLVDRTQCTLEGGQTRCPVTVDWAADSSTLFQEPSVFRYDISSGSRTRLSTGYSGQIVDDLPPGRFQYELRTTLNPVSALLYRTPEVRVESQTPAQVWVDRTECTAPSGGTCDITVGWSANALATPGATLFRRDLNTNQLTPLRTATVGTLVDPLPANQRVRYELHSTVDPVSPLLAYSADVQTLAAAASTVFVDRAQCTAPAGGTCSIQVTWSSDATVFPGATLFRRDVVFGTMTPLQTATSGSLTNALRSGERAVYELRATSNPTSTRLAQSQEVTAVAPAPSSVSVNSTSCIVPVNATTCPIQVTWTSDATVYPGATLFRRNVTSSTISILQVAPNGQITDNVMSGERIVYELRASNNVSSTLLASSSEVTARSETLSSVSATPTQCTVPQGATTCSVQIAWTTDAQLNPGATLFRRNATSNEMTLIQTGTSGSFSEALPAGTRWTYELRASSTAGSALLAASSLVEILATTAPTTISVNTTRCTIPEGQSTCTVRITWSTDVAQNPQASLFRRDSASGALTLLRSSVSGTFDDALPAGSRVTYELRQTSDAGSERLVFTDEVSVTTATPSTVTATPTQCTVPQGATTCSVQVVWATDAQLNPGATLFRRNATTNVLTLIQSGVSGSFSDAQPAGTRWTYELRATSTPTSGLLASSALVEILAAVAPTTLTPDRTSCTVPEQGATCAIHLSWSTDATQNPQASLFRRNSTTGAMTLLRSGTSGTFDDALTTGSRVTYELRRTSDPTSERLATTAEVVAVAATPSTVTATPNPCEVAADASTCAVVVRWATDATINPNATLYSVDPTTNVAAVVQTAVTGTSTQTLSAGATRRYELYPTATRTGTPLASVTATAIIAEGSGPAAVAPAPQSPTLPTADPTGDAVGATAAEFRVDEAGQANYRIPIYAPRGAGGVQPAFALAYNSQTPDGPLGAGWALEGLSTISRCRESTEAGDGAGPVNTNQASDGFAVWNKFCLDGQRLMLESGTHGTVGAVYRTEIDTGLTIRIASSDGTANPLTWEIEGKDGLKHVLGGPDATLANGTKRLSWQVQSTTDSNGNVIAYTYSATSVDARRGQRLLSEATYRGGKIVFSYVAARQADSRNVAGLALTTTQQLTSVESFAAPHSGNGLTGVRKYTLAYDPFLQSYTRDRISSITECGRASADSAYVCRAPTTFDWAELCLMPNEESPNALATSAACACSGGNDDCDLSPMPALQSSSGSGVQGIRHFIELNSVKYGDIDGDGRQDVVWHEEEQDSTDELRVSFSVPSSAEGVNFETSQSVHTFGDNYSDNRSWFLYDFDADGRDDLLVAEENTARTGGLWKVKLSRNLPVRTNAASRAANFATAVDPVPTGAQGIPYSGEDASAMLADINADGLPDLLTINKVPRGNTVESVLQVRYLQRVTVGELAYTFGSAKTVNITFDRAFGCADLGFGHFRHESLDAFDIDGDGWSELALVANATTCRNGNGTPQVHGNRARQPATMVVNEPPNPAGIAAIESRYWYVLRNEGPAGQGHKFQAVRRYNAGYATDGEEEPKSTLQIVDINADGLADVVFMDKNRRWRYRLGDGSLTPESIESGDETQLKCVLPVGAGTECATIEYPKHAFLTDFDGDGRLDFWYLWNTQNRPGFSIARWIGDRFEFNGQPTFTSRYTFRGQEWQHQLTDLDADGHLDFFAVRGFRIGGSGPRDSGDWAVNRPASHHAPRGVIQRIENGLGAITEIDYAPMTFNDVYQREVGVPVTESGMAYGRGAEVFNIAGPSWVVRSAQSSAPTIDDTAAMSQVQYRYGGMRMQAGGRGALGFRTMATYDWQSGVETATEYRQAFPYVGRPARTVSTQRAAWSAGCATGTYDSVGCMTYTLNEISATGVRLSDSRSEWQFRQRGTLQESLPNAAEKSLQILNTLQEQRYYDANYTGTIFDHANPVEALTHWETTEFLADTTADAVSCPRGYDRALNACKSKVTRTRRTATGGSIVDQIVESRFSYGADASTGQRLGRLLRSSIKHSRPYNFDGSASGTPDVTRVATFEYDATTSLLSAEHVQPEGSAAEQLHTYYQRDGFGNVTRKSVCSTANRATCEATAANDANYQPTTPLQIARYARTEYDPLNRYGDKTYAVHRRNGVVQEVLVGEVVDRDLLGAATNSVDANGVRAQAVFGAFGRQRFAKVSSGGFAHTLVSSCDVVTCPAGGAYRIEETPAGSPRSWTYVDVLERPILKLQDGFAVGKAIAVGTGYDNLGRIKRVTEPYFALGAEANDPAGAIQSIAFTETFYDAQGRVTQVTRPDQTIITTAYAGLTTTATLPENNAVTSTERYAQTRTEHRNAVGEIAKVEESLGQGLSNFFTATGDVRKVEIAGQTQTIDATYDVLGRKRTLTDPDVGAWSYVVNALGEVVTERSPRGVCSRLDYDMNGRLYRRRDYAAGTYDNINGGCGTGTADTESTWEYDTLEIGQLTEQRLGSHSVRFGYDAYHRPASVTRSHDSGAERYVQRSTYDEYGRPFQRFFRVEAATPFAGGSAISLPETGELFEYNGQGFAYRTRNAFPGLTGRVYHEVETMTARGQVEREVRKAGIAVTTQRGYELATGRLRTIGTANGALQDLEYDYDDVGNVVERSDHSFAAPMSESFVYDAQQRLKTTTRELNGVQSTDEVSYDSANKGAGNIASKTGLGTYTYGTRAALCTESGEITPGPHAVSQAGVHSYCYDARGNLVRDSRGRRIAYTLFDLPSRMTNTNTNRKVEFEYGAGRERVRRRDYATAMATAPSAITDYAGEAEVRRSAEGIEVKRYLGPIMLIQKSSASGSVSLSRDYLFTDALGSTHVVTDSFGALKSNGQQGFDAWGARRSVDTAQVLSEGVLAQFDTRATTGHGFTGHEQVDEIGLIHMNGRIYDAVLGRFVQADVIVQSPLTAQSWNRYAYVFNNPLGNVDPTGHLSQGWRAAIALAVTIYTAGTASGASWGWYGASVGTTQAATWTIVGGAVAGGVQSGNLRGAVTGALSAAMFYQIGGANLGAPEKVVAHGIAGGVMAELQGGSFGHGFASAALTQAMSPAFDQISTMPGRIAFAAVVGGTTSVITGGKFANGAVTAAFSRAFNDETHEDYGLPECPSEMGCWGYAPPSSMTDAEFGEMVATFIPGVDLLVCANAGCNPMGWSLAALGVVPGGKAGAKGYSVFFETTISKAGIGTRPAHFAEANRNLSAALQSDAGLAEMAQGLGVQVPLRLGQSPANWSWHHVPDRPGVLQLVPRAQHQGGPWQPLLHPEQQGGFKIWGSEY